MVVSLGFSKPDAFTTQLIFTSLSDAATIMYLVQFISCDTFIFTFIKFNFAGYVFYNKLFILYAVVCLVFIKIFCFYIYIYVVWFFYLFSLICVMFVYTTHVHSHTWTPHTKTFCTLPSFSFTFFFPSPSLWAILSGDQF